MLEEMRIRGLGVIDDAVLELGPGLTVVTGETGAGKTMVVHGLALLAGGRADAGLVRPGSDRAVVEGRLVVDPDGPAAARAADAGAELDDGAVLEVSRTIVADGGRSRAHVGGRSVPLGVLSDVCGSLVALHGQHDQQRLLGGAEQRLVLDRYAGEELAGPFGSYRVAFTRWQQVDAEITEITTRRRERAQEAELLRLGLAEIAGVAPQAGEDADLTAEVARLAHADQLRSAASAAQRALTGDPTDAAGEVDAAGLVGAARTSLAGVVSLDADLDAVAARLAEVAYLLGDCAADLSAYAASVDADPVRLDQAQQRQAALATLTRKYAADIAGVVEWADLAASRLAELSGDDDRLEELQGESRALEAQLAELASAVSAARRAAAARLGAGVTAELAELAMPHALLDVRVEQTPAERGGLVVDGLRVACTRDGVDSVEILLVPHAGAPARAVAKGASGGELSRVMLALEVVLADADPVPTMVFDEVDAGVGGRAAVEVGRRLARLARSHQVVVVTHLPQVAAFADRHLRVVKSDDGSVTASDVVLLDDAARVIELSRMLAGLEDSTLARGHAEELLAAAAADKVR
ncbi:MAG TPA: DNA repair protein RecN [Mycobacteriales bacterium]|nr:DNA repair protein RecN [Mycobacteriales bacterium]